MNKSNKLLVLVPVLGLFLAGCSYQEVKHSISTSWIGEHILHPVYDPIKKLIKGDKEEAKPEEEPKEETPSEVTPSEDPAPSEGEGGESTDPETPAEEEEEEKGYSFKSEVEYFASKGIADVVIPNYPSETAVVTYDKDYGFYLAVEETEDLMVADMAAYVEVLTKAGWNLTKDKYDDYSGYFGSTAAYVSIQNDINYPADEPYGGIVIQFIAKIFDESLYESLFAAFEMDVKIPHFDTSDPSSTTDMNGSAAEYGLLYVYVNKATAEDLTAFETALVGAGWVDESESGYVVYHYGETDAYVYIYDTNIDDAEDPYVTLIFVADIMQAD